MPKQPAPRGKPPTVSEKTQARQAKQAEASPEHIILTLAANKGRLRGQGRHGDGSKKVVTPTTKEFGNTLGDRAWLTAARSYGLIEEVPADAEGEIPAGARFQYTGPMIARKDFWSWPPDGERCSAESYMRDEEGHYILGQGYFQLKRPCALRPIVGGPVCVPHGGGIERVRRAAELRLLGAADAVIGALIVIALDTKADEKARVQAINSILDRAQIKGVTQIEVDVPAYREAIKNAFKGWGEPEDADGDD
jgi:hypothetical protein